MVSFLNVLLLWNIFLFVILFLILFWKLFIFHSSGSWRKSLALLCEMTLFPIFISNCSCAILATSHIDWIRRNNCSVSATSVSRILPSAAWSLKALQFVTVSFPSYFRRCFSLFQYDCESYYAPFMCQTFCLCAIRAYNKMI